MQVWISAYSLNHLCSNGFNNDSSLGGFEMTSHNSNLLMYIVGPVEYDLTTEIYKFCLYQWASLSWGLPCPRRILLSSNSADLHNNSFLWNLAETTNICGQNPSDPSKQPHVCCHFSWLWAHLFGLSLQLSLALCSYSVIKGCNIPCRNLKQLDYTLGVTEWFLRHLLWYSPRRFVLLF